VTQNSAAGGGGGVLVTPMPGRKGPGTPFRFASSEKTSGTAFRRVPSQKYPLAFVL
jgi:hypothetical protein